MSQITDALNKVQKSRQGRQGQKTGEVLHATDTSQASFRILVISIIAAGAILTVFINAVVITFVIRSAKSNQYEIYTLAKSLKTQEKKINDLIVFRLKNEIENRKNQINNLGLIDNVYYINIMKSIIANEHQINYLNKYTNELEQKIKSISAPNSWVKDVVNPLYIRK